MFPADPRAEERVGSVLHDKWTLERLLGVGGMGAVYAARHRNGARAAVKILSPSMGRVPHVRKRFLHEGYAANRVDHAGAVKVLDDDVIQDGADEGTAYLVMELLEGESLGDRAKREPALGERELLEIADGVLAVLEAAHTNGVVHRDLKPDNLFLARDPEREGSHVKVLDFGLARLLEAQELTIAGMAVGTPTYMSPEQASGHVDKIDGRTDIYALGSILFQLAAHKRIHDAAHTLGLVVRMATTPAPKIRTVAPDVSEPFARVVDHALAFAREDRYPNAAAMRADVSAALSNLPAASSTQPRPIVAALPPTSPALLDTVRVPAVAAAAATPSLGASNRTRTERRERPRTSRAWFLVFALLAIGGGLWWTKRPAELEPAAAPSATPSVATSAAPTASVSEVDATVSSSPDAAPSIDDASAVAVALDGSVDEPVDASADASDDDDEDDDDEMVDASVAPSASASAGGHRAGTPTVTKPKKKHPPRRPGAPKRKRRWRY